MLPEIAALKAFNFSRIGPEFNEIWPTDVNSFLLFLFLAADLQSNSLTNDATAALAVAPVRAKLSRSKKSRHPALAKMKGSGSQQISNFSHTSSVISEPHRMQLTFLALRLPCYQCKHPVAIAQELTK